MHLKSILNLNQRYLKQIFLPLGVLLCVYPVYSQYDHYWYFGNNAGLNFNTNPPGILTNGQLQSYESGSAISDANGNLLFYSNGERVWNKNHSIMSNGYNLMGHFSTTQGCLIIPFPGNPDMYYIFTLDNIGGPDGLRYSTVDMTMDNGNGAVVSKNVLLHSNMTEKLCAVKRCDGNYWIVSHEWQSNKFFANLITPTGIGTVVVSSVGMVHSGGGSSGILNSVGCMKFSRSGEKLAVGVMDVANYELFDFNLQTGIITNPMLINSPVFGSAYSLEFSGDDSKLYCTDHYNGKLYQFDLNAGSLPAILASETLVGSTSPDIGLMELGPDDRIYLSLNTHNDQGRPYLAVINNPNASGLACGFLNNAIHLGGKESRSGLNNKYVDRAKFLWPNPIFPLEKLTICKGDSLMISADLNGNNYQFQWYGASNATTDTITVSPDSTSIYILEVSKGLCSIFDTLEVEVISNQGPALPADTTSCNPIQFDLSGYQNVAWNGNFFSPTYLADSTQVVWVSLDDPVTGCTIRDTVNIRIEGTPDLIMPPNQTICKGDSITITPTVNGQGNYQYQWSGGVSSSASSLKLLPISTEWYVLEINAGGCTVKDSVQITVKAAPRGNLLPSDTTYCSAITLTLGSGLNNVIWNGTISSNTYIADTSQIVWVEAEDPLTGCILNDTIEIKIGQGLDDEPRIIYEIPDCYDGKYTFYMLHEKEGLDYRWDFGNGTVEQGPSHSVQYELPGNYPVVLEVIDTVCGVSYYDSVDIEINQAYREVFIPNIFTPNQDGVNELFEISGKSCGYDQMQVFNRWGTRIFETDKPFEVFWDGYYEGRECTQGVYFYILLYGDGQEKYGTVTLIR